MPRAHSPCDIVPACQGCARVVDGRCLAFETPALQWQTSRCWGRTTDEQRVVEELFDVLQYAKRRRDRDAIQSANNQLRMYSAAREAAQLQAHLRKNASPQARGRAKELRAWAERESADWLNTGVGVALSPHMD